MRFLTENAEVFRIIHCPLSIKNMYILPVMFATPAYDEMVHLRIKHLYEPLGAEINLEEFANEYKDLHLAVYNNNTELIGAVLAQVSEEEDDALVKRKICLLADVVVEKTVQGRGLGAEIIAELERMMIDKGYKELRINAHLGVVEFYEKLGYAKHGKEFMLRGITQQTMKKKLQNKSDKLEKLEPVNHD